MIIIQFFENLTLLYSSASPQTGYPKSVSFQNTMLMQRLVWIIVLILATLAFPCELESQIWPFRKKGQAERASRDLERRQKESGQNQGNAFNPLQPMGSSRNIDREDHIWSSETAYISNLYSGNISITTPSRLGVHRQLELQSMLGALYWSPNLMIKKRWHSGNWWWATRHGGYFPSNGLTWAKDKGHHSIADTTVRVPQIITFKNELIVSKPFFSDYSCVTGHPYLIISAGLSFDYSTALSDNDLIPINEHLLGARSTALTGQGLLVIARIRADARILTDLTVEGGFKYFTGQNNLSNVLEHHANINYFLASNFSISPGYILSFGDLGASNPALFPFFDITWYFGQKPRRPTGLF